MGGVCVTLQGLTQTSGDLLRPSLDVLACVPLQSLTCLRILNRPRVLTSTICTFAQTGVAKTKLESVTPP